MSAPRLRIPATSAACVAVALSLLAILGPGQALAGSAHWSVLTRPAPSALQPGKPGAIVTVVTNLGDEAIVATAQNPLYITQTLPEGVPPTKIKAEREAGAESAHPAEKELTCAALPMVRCEFVGTVLPYGSLMIKLQISPSSTFSGGLTEVKLEGAGPATQPLVQMLTTSEQETVFGVEHFELNAEEENGNPDRTAGSHPFALATNLSLKDTVVELPGGKELYGGLPRLLKNVFTTLPPGLIGNPLAVKQCSDSDFSTLSEGENDCPQDTAVGVAVVTLTEPNFVGLFTTPVPIYNLVPAKGEPARFGFVFVGVPVTIETGVKTGDGYAVEADVRYASAAAEPLATNVVVWGIPGASVHDNSRGWGCLAGNLGKNSHHPPVCENVEEKNPKPYLTMPTQCRESLTSSVQVQSWDPSETLEPPVEYQSPPLLGCSSLPFNPTLTVTPDEHTTSTPTGVNVEVKIPQEATLSANSPAEADVFATELEFPEGLDASAGAAVGLEACKVGEVGFDGGEDYEGRGVETTSGLESTIERQHFTPGEANCPNASKIGEVDIHSPLLENDLKGYAYLATQNTNPFASPLVLYFVAEDPVSGVRVKLAGETRIEPNGQLIGVFRNTPPVPAETIKLHLFDGARASLATPAYCRTYESHARFQTWSEQRVERSSSFTPEATPTGAPCQSGGPLPFSPKIAGGATNSRAGSYSPFTFTVERPDGQEGLTGVTTALPPGMAAKLASVTPCQEPPNEVEWSCGADSKIGEAHASSGLGTVPVNLTGQAYLTTGYEGAPFGLLVRTEAKAGPFNLGFVNVRSKILVNEETAAVTVTTAAGPHHEPGGRAEELPTIFKGVPVQLKALNVTVNRSEFEFNGTNCEPMSIVASLTANEGGSETSSLPFQVTNCQNLPFAPKFSATVASQGSKSKGVTAVFTVESGGIGAEGIRKVFLTVPKILPARLQPTLQNACLDKVFAENPAKCPEDAFIGRATVTTPVLKNPLTGPAILVSHGNAAFPDVEFVLQGEGIHVLLDGKTDIKKGVTYSRFESAPDAPFTKFVTELPEGPHSIFTDNTEIVPTYNVCNQKILAPTELTAQDGAVISQDTQFGISGKCAAVKKKSLLEIALENCKKKYKGGKAKVKAKRESCEKAARKKHPTKHTTKHSKRR
jgi:hypothetical protein